MVNSPTFMKRNSTSESGIFNPRTFLGFSLCSAGVLLALISFGKTSENSPPAASTSGGATIYVTTTAQKIGGIGTGGCSLQEAILSSQYHSNTFPDPQNAG